MSIFGIARGLGVLGLQVWDAASFILRPDRPFFEPRDGADWLAEREAAEEVTEPQEGCDGKCATDECVCPVLEDDEPQADCGLARNEYLGPYSEPNEYFADLEPSRTPDKLDSIIWLLEDVRNLLVNNASATPASSRTAVEQADGPEVEVSPTPSTSGHLTFGTDPSAMYERMLRQRLNEDRDPTK